MLAKTVTGFALVATRLQTKKRSGLFCRSWPDLSRIHTFGVVREGLALLGMALPNIENGSHFCSDPGQYLERARTFGEGLQRVRTFGHGLVNYSEGFALLDICSKGFALSAHACEGFTLFAKPSTILAHFCKGF